MAKCLKILSAFLGSKQLFRPHKIVDAKDYGVPQKKKPFDFACFKVWRINLIKKTHTGKK